MRIFRNKINRNSENKSQSIDELINQKLHIGEFIAAHLFLYFPNSTNSQTESKTNADYLASKGYSIGDFHEIKGQHYYKLDYTHSSIPDKLTHGINTTFANRKGTISPVFASVLLIQNEDCTYFSLKDGQISKLFTSLLERSITEVHFINIAFEDFEFNNGETKLNRLFFSECYFKQAVAWWDQPTRSSKSQFELCTFSKFKLKGRGGFLNLNESTIELLISETTSQIEYVNIKRLNLFLLDNLELDQISFTRVNIRFDPKIIHKYRKVDTAKRYLNSFLYIRNTRGLRSEQNEIDRYINYFRSRENILHKFIFWFNGGYNNIITPFFSFVISMSASKIILDMYNLYPSPNSMSVLFNPKQLMTQVILKDFSFHIRNIYPPKVWVAFLAVISAYSLFCLLAAVRKRYGFPRLG